MSSVQLEIRIQTMCYDNQAIMPLNDNTTIQDLMKCAHSSDKIGWLPIEQRPVYKRTDLTKYDPNAKLVTLFAKLNPSYLADADGQDRIVIHLVWKNPDRQFLEKYNALIDKYAESYNKIFDYFVKLGSASSLGQEAEKLIADLQKERDAKLDSLPTREHFAHEYPTTEAWIAYVQSAKHKDFWNNFATAKFMDISPALKGKIETLEKAINSTK